MALLRLPAGGGIRTDEGYKYRVPPGRPLCGSPLICGTEAGSLNISARAGFPIHFPPVLQERNFSHAHFLCCTTLQARTISWGKTAGVVGI